jgi:hypothetical protein
MKMCGMLALDLTGDRRTTTIYTHVLQRGIADCHLASAILPGVRVRAGEVASLGGQ